MTHSAQGSFDVLRLPRQWARVAIAATLMLGSAVGVFYHAEVVAQERDRIVIRGPEGAEKEDVRLGTERYGPIKATDTLWSIANQNRPHSSVDVPQMMAAIVQANPDAFRNSNPSEMLTGFYLRIPSLQEVQMMNPEAARRQVELGEQLERQERVLTEQERLTQQRREEQDKLVQETRTRTEQAIDSVRARHEQEFVELRENLLRSIESTENVFRDNEALKERLVRLEDLLTALEAGVVSATEYEEEINELKEAQKNLRREQDIVRARTEEKSVVEELLDQPAVLVLLASVPALLMILLTTWLLRRRQLDMSGHDIFSDGPTEREEELELSDEEARDALERELMGGITTEEDDLLSDDPFEGFDDDEGADLDRLSDEMLMPTIEPDLDDKDDFGIRLDDSDDDLGGDDFSELDDDFDALPSDAKTADEDFTSLVETELDSAAEGGDSLGQDDLDRLLAGASDDDEINADDIAATATDDDSVAVDTDDIDALLDSFGVDEGDEDTAVEEDKITPPDNDGELLPEEPSEVDPFDPDVLLDQVQQAQEAAESDEEVDDIDIDELFNELGIDDDDNDDISPDDIDSLLAEASEGESELDAENIDDFADDVEQDLVFGDEDEDDTFLPDEEEEGDESLADDEDDDLINLAELDEQDTELADEKSDEWPELKDIASTSEIDFKSLAADEELDEELFELDDDELAQATAEAESELESLFDDDDGLDAEPESDNAAASSEGFLDIDDIIAEADDHIEHSEDDENDDDSLRAEDQLAAQLDLARAYLEMDEKDNAREALQEVLESGDEALRAEAEELLKRIDN